MAEFKPIPTDPRFKDLTDQKIGRILVLGYLGKVKRIHRWLGQCDCGKVWDVSGAGLLKGTKSCGCANKRSIKSNPEYRVWKGMKERCYYHKHIAFQRYGGRGIVVSDRWRNSFENFLSDMGPRPTPHHQIERLDNDGPYSKENCCWATAAEQATNKSNNRILELNGQSKTLAEWSKETGIHHNVIHSRLRRGWDVRRALTTKARRCIKRIIPDECTIPRLLILARLAHGWTIERATTQPVRRRCSNKIPHVDLVPRHILLSRLRRGWTFERASRTPFIPRKAT